MSGQGLFMLPVGSRCPTTLMTSPVRPMTKTTSHRALLRRFRSGRDCSGAEVLAEPLTHLLDRRVHFGHTARAEDEGVLSFWERVNL